MADNKEYLVRGAILVCDCGCTTSILELPEDHGVYTKKELPMVHEDDNKVGRNIRKTSFGACASESPPSEVAQIITIPSVDEAGEPIGVQIEGIACSPVITQSWKEPHETVFIDGGGAKKRALTTDSFLMCKYGGRITPYTSGQENA